MASSGPDRCPDCAYDLTGLPPPHRCPECGQFAYDEHTRIWFPRHPWEIYLATGLSMIVPAYYFVMYVSMGIALASESLAATFRMLLAAGIPLAGAIFFLRATRIRRYIAITPSGLRGRTRSGDLFVPWERLYACSAFGPTPAIIQKGRDMVYLTGVFDSPAEQEAFRKAVEQARVRYARKPGTEQKSVALGADSASVPAPS